MSISMAVGFTLAWVCGHRGFFGFDQSILFDGGYRVFQGQIPYADFYIPTGPLSFWLQGIFFRILGVNYSATVALAAVLNAVGALLSFRLLMIITSGRRFAAFLGAVLTSVWLFPPFGTPWFEPIGHFFILLMVYLLVKAIYSYWDAPSYADLRNLPIITFAAGITAICALLTKQTVGIEAFLIAGLLWIGPPRRPGLRNLGAYPLDAFLLGIVSAAIVFGLWLFIFSDPGAFWHYTVDLPVGVGSGRLNLAIVKYKMSRLILFTPALWIVHILAGGVALIGIFRSVKDGLSAKRAALAAQLAVALALVTYLEMMIAANHGAIAAAFIGISWSLGLSLVCRFHHDEPGLGRVRPRRNHSVIIVIAPVLWILAAWVGLKIGWSRDVQDPVAGARLRPPLELAGLSGLRWQETVPGPGVVSEEDFVQLVQWLRDNPKPFFVWADYTILYGLCDVPSPQPVLWFHWDLTYPRGGDEALESRILRDLARNNVERIVYEAESWHGTEERLEDFPKLRRMMQAQFVEVHRIGPFRILERPAPLP
ncbi:MAG: hypothetical protein KJ970_17840 [Candidatus Eisenbacteria bacterium]|uniref:Uncharacterized protein n=1 Tax=Eiseniibacteriota bacterium TaxID=2212470 RepID=A0A948WEH8_UNCEI|nr:hypothetical protein [Candidatus Eisenbacteria bacterium]